MLPRSMGHPVRTRLLIYIVCWVRSENIHPLNSNHLRIYNHNSAPDGTTEQLPARHKHPPEQIRPFPPTYPHV